MFLFTFALNVDNLRNAYSNFKFFLFIYISTGHKKWAKASFPVQSKIFPELKAQIVLMRYQKVQKVSGFTVDRKEI